MPSSPWQGVVAVATVLALVVGALMLVVVPFAGLRQMGSALLVMGLGMAMFSNADILVPILLRMGMVVIAVAGGYLLVLEGGANR